MILSINASGYDNALVIMEVVKKYDRHCREKSRSMVQGNVDMLVEIRMKDYEAMLQELNKLECVYAVSLIAHKGDAAY